ncbi:MAG: indolepyruvate ferredoxin oxidoreductase family protein [Burkholderiaceae bacterium]|nr:indolepyruvate ferredoxin oxidoreductase family protein [Burkholderiaceae bacterium]
MNAPVEAALRRASLDDRYEATEGNVYLTGTQALVRLPILQRQRDAAAGLNTAGYVSGYRGSPLGGYDQALEKARAHLDAHHIRFVPGLNEDLAATAIWGTQQIDALPGARYDGVFSIWYGKGPGVDRSGDVFRHANHAGTARHGGVLALAGDDHGAKSSTVAAQTDFVFQAVSIPVLSPATVQDYVDFGVHGFAMSRYAGLWVALKCVTDTIESAGIVDVSRDRVHIVQPEDFAMPAGGLSLRWPEEPFLKLEERLSRFKVPAALAYARANRLDRNVFGRPDDKPARLGIVSSGKSWLDVMQALADLGIGDEDARALGVRVLKVAMPWPLEPQSMRAFAEGCEELLVIEEKRSLIEAQLKELLYGLAERPRVVGKTDEDGAALAPDYGELTPAFCARLIGQRLARWSGAADDARGARAEAVRERIDARLAALDARERAPAKRFETIERIPYFCSGCPHNTSTRVPEGSRALAGIGCHYMAQWMDRSTATFTQMGGEGMTWVGLAPFSNTPHVFQNIGDGTWFHSGSLALRHAVATNTRMTYKILFNDAVAMTGGQRHDGALTPQRIAQQVRAEGVRRIAVVTDEPDKYPAGYFDPDIEVHHRSRLDDVQRELRDYDGVSVLIYDQTCAAEKRRRRKRGEFPDPPKRVFINEAVCEGCGDCGVQSNCVSIEPVQTEFGRKRAINQSSCNKDFSCVNGFCPSFVTVHGGRVRRASAGAAAASVAPGAPAVAQASRVPGASARPTLALPEVTLTEPTLPDLAQAWSLLVTGIGGTGVVTIGQLLGMAAHLEGRQVTVLDMAGLAQKNGAVMSFVRFAQAGEALYAPRIGVAGADAVLGCDLVVTAGREALARMSAATRVVTNVSGTPTADFTRNPDWKFPAGGMQSAIADAVGEHNVAFIDATRLATALLGDAIASNLFLLGYGWQQGLVPLSGAAIDRAIELNGVAIEQNRAAFAWGRAAALDRGRVEAAAGVGLDKSAPVPVSRRLSVSLDETIARRVDYLVDYQDERYASRYRQRVERVRDAERPLVGEAPLALTEAVARNLFKLMAYKDEYEVARLYTASAFRERLNEQFEGDFRLSFHLAPPLLARRNAKGELVKREYGPWVMNAFAVLARLRRLRGTAFDPFGRTEERRSERQLVVDYEATVDRLLATLDEQRLPLAVRIASIPDEIRGFGHVKARNLESARKHWTEEMARYQAQAAAPAQVS